MSLINKIIGKLNLSPTKEKVFRNVVWAVTGKIVTMLGSLLVGIFVARYLGPEQYGLMNYVVSFVMLFQVFASFGMDNIEIREESKIPEEKDKIIGTAFTLKIGFAVITIGLVCLMAWLFETNSFTKWMIVLYSLSMIMNSFNVIRNYFTSLVWNEYIVKTEISRTLIGAGIKVVLLLLDAPFIYFFIAILFDTILIAGGYIISYHRKIDSIRKWKFDKTTAIYMIKQSFPLAVSLSAVLIYHRIDQIMVGKMLTNTELGYYSVASKFTEIIMFIPTILAQTITPILVRNYQEDFAVYRSKTQQFVNITVWICIIISVITALISHWLILYTFGSQYLPATIVLQILAFKSVGDALSATAGNMIIIEGVQKYAWIRSVTACFVCIGLNLLFIPKWGLIGTAIASILTYLYAGTFSNIFIPQYWFVLKTQIKALFLGWKDLLKLKQLLQS